MHNLYFQQKRNKIPLTNLAMFQKNLRVGMQVCFGRPGYKHHGIVSKVSPTECSYEIIHMTGDTDTIFDKQVKGIAEIRRETQSFDVKDKMKVYDYGECSFDKKIREEHNISCEISNESIVSKRASLLHEAFEMVRDDVYYKMFEFNCEHFACYCATGLAYCKQKEGMAMTENLRATTLLDKK